MALAIHFDRLLREGTVASYSEIARLAGVSPAWITAIMKLVDLPVPERENALLAGESIASV
jgi:alkylated DNA nucleotide flippase Atl1